MRHTRRQFLFGLIGLLALWAVVTWSIYASYAWSLQHQWEQRADLLAQRFQRSLSDTELQLSVFAQALGSRLASQPASSLGLASDPLVERLQISQILLHSSQRSSVLYSSSALIQPGLWRATVYDFYKTQSPVCGLELTEYGPRVTSLEPTPSAHSFSGIEVSVSLTDFLKNFSRREGVEVALLVPQAWLHPSFHTSARLEDSAAAYQIIASSSASSASTLSSLPGFGPSLQAGSTLRAIVAQGTGHTALATLPDVEYRPTSVASVGSGSLLVFYSDYSATVAATLGQMRQVLWLVSVVLLFFGAIGVFLFIRYRAQVHGRVTFYREALHATNQSLKIEAHARQQAEERLRGMADDMYAARQNDLRLMALLAHQLKLNAAATLGFAQLLQGQSPNPYDQDNLQSLQQLGQRVFSMAENVELWGRREALLQACRPQPQPLLPAVEQALQSLQPLATRKHLSVQTSIPAHLVVMGDTLLLQAILKNLLSNAYKFSPCEGEVTLQARAIASGIELTLADHGQGISTAVMEKLFEPDVDKIHRGTEGEEGLGLGLLIVKWACQVLGVQLRITSDEGRGCRVSLVFVDAAGTPHTAPPLPPHSR